MRTNKAILVLVALLFLSAISAPSHATSTYTPKKGDFFAYHETIDLNNGQNSYSGYTEHQDITGSETMNQVYANGTVAAHYLYTWHFTNTTTSTTGSSAGNFTYSSTTYYYIKGTDNQTGYVNPTVWFYMDNSVPKSGTFGILNTQLTVLDTNASFFLPSQNRYVQSIHGQGPGSYYRNDVYGKFNAQYTWDAYFDPKTGYIIGYNYVETDRDNSGNGFTWTDVFYVTSTSYSLATGATPSNSNLSQLIFFALAIVGIFVFVIIVAVIAIVLRRRGKLPQHAYDYSRVPTPYAPPAPQNIDLEPKQQPAQQIVIKEVAKVKCKYCGALVDTTATVCPVCGGPTT
jgi:hypothetical protein